VQRRLERALRHLHHAARRLLQALRDGVPVQGRGPSATTFRINRSSVPCGRSDFVGVTADTSIFYMSAGYYINTCRSARYKLKPAGMVLNGALVSPERIYLSCAQSNTHGLLFQ
jgi:hypothetical protein